MCVVVDEDWVISKIGGLVFRRWNVEAEKQLDIPLAKNN